MALNPNWLQLFDRYTLRNSLLDAKVLEVICAAYMRDLVMIRKSENIKRIRREMAESMKNRNRVEDDSDLVDLVRKRMATDKREFVLMDWVKGSKGDE